MITILSALNEDLNKALLSLK